MTKQRILIISLVGIFIFGLLVGGRVIYQKKWIDVNILSQSQQIPGVVSAKTVQNNGQKEIIVVTNHIENLRQTSQVLDELAGELPIRYLDRRDDALEKVFDEMQFALQEGVARGNFTEMAQNVRMQAEKASVQLEIEMDNDAIYVIINRGDAQLIEVLERHGQVNFLTSKKQ